MKTLGEIIELRVPSKPEYVSIVRTLVTDFAYRMAFSASAIEDMRVAVSEACANVVCHAYPSTNHRTDQMTVRLASIGGRLVMEIADEGQGFIESVPRPQPADGREGGLGLVLIRNLMDQVSLNSEPNQGTVVHMEKCSGLNPIRRTAFRTPRKRIATP